MRAPESPSITNPDKARYANPSWKWTLLQCLSVYLNMRRTLTLLHEQNHPIQESTPVWLLNQPPITVAGLRCKMHVCIWTCSWLCSRPGSYIQRKRLPSFLSPFKAVFVWLPVRHVRILPSSQQYSESSEPATVRDQIRRSIFWIGMVQPGRGMVRPDRGTQFWRTINGVKWKLIAPAAGWE